MRTISCDGGAFISPESHFKFHNAYFTVIDDITGELIHHEKNIGDFYSGLAEYLAIEWAVKNIPDRPLLIYSDCTTAIAWAKGNGQYKKWGITPPDLTGIQVVYKKGTEADKWNAQNHSPKHDKSFYVKRYYDSEWVELDWILEFLPNNCVKISTGDETTIYELPPFPKGR